MEESGYCYPAAYYVVSVLFGIL